MRQGSSRARAGSIPKKLGCGGIDPYVEAYGKTAGSRDPLNNQPFAHGFCTMTPLPASIDATLELLRSGGYVPDRALATVLFLSLKMGKVQCRSSGIEAFL